MNTQPTTVTTNALTLQWHRPIHFATQSEGGKYRNESRAVQTNLQFITLTSSDYLKHGTHYTVNLLKSLLQVQAPRLWNTLPLIE